MKQKHYRTSEVAKIIGVHPNTILSYEKWGYLSTVPRSENGYRMFTEQHIGQINIIRLALSSEAVKAYMLFEVRGILRTIAKGDIKMAIALSENFLTKIQKEKAKEYEVIIEIKKIIKKHLEESENVALKRSEAAEVIGVSIDVIINWERNGMLEVPRDNKNNYRVYTKDEMILLEIIKHLRKENYLTQCIVKMIKKIKSNNFEFLNKNEVLLSSIEEKENNIKNLIFQLSTMINKE